MSFISSKLILSFTEISIVSILQLNLFSNCSMRVLIAEIFASQLSNLLRIRSRFWFVMVIFGFCNFSILQFYRRLIHLAFYLIYKCISLSVITLCQANLPLLFYTRVYSSVATCQLIRDSISILKSEPRANRRFTAIFLTNQMWKDFSILNRSDGTILPLEYKFFLKMLIFIRLFIHTSI